MENSFRTHILICAGTGCVASGSLKVKDAIVEEINKHGIQNEVKVATTGCNGFCALGPIIVAHPGGFFFNKVNVEDVPFFVEEHLVKGRVPQKYLFDGHGRDEAIPLMNDIEFFISQILVEIS